MNERQVPTLQPEATNGRFSASIALMGVWLFFWDRLACSKVCSHYDRTPTEPIDVMQPLETHRLLLLPLEIADAPAIQRSFAKWEIVRWLGEIVPWPYPDDGAAVFLENVVLPAMRECEAWHWSIRPKTIPGKLIGVISLREQDNDNRGFWLDLEWQGRGLMTEACDAVTDFWFDVLGKAALRVPKAVENIASRRISEKQAMRVISRFQQKTVSGPCDAELWEMTCDEWRATRSRTSACR